MSNKIFKPPEIIEIEIYIKEKKEWPDEFIKYYADRFYNFYTSNGWKVSGRAAMKDWKAAFNSQWQTLKFKEDIDALNKIKLKAKGETQKTNSNKSASMTDIEKLDDLLASYKKNSSSINFESLADWYEYLKTNKLMRVFTKDDVEMIKKSYGTDTKKCRAACVQMTLTGYVNSELRFSDVIQMRSRLNV